ncbi:MAG: type II toxin-antitoxin system VapC family toxin [Fibrobacter intestinalis]|uniref:type II toxin-antitoxin system VapC family toxin n=1 Tax=Fibrobacter intestinalis TaxID=28122 RepID=UPI000D6D2E3A
MKVLLDTHIALWTLLDSEKLPIEARKLINQENVEPVFSLISMWEIVIKHAINPNKMPISGAQFLDYCTQAGFQQLMVYEEHVLEVEKLKRDENAPSHKDPFDRMLIAQAKAEGIILLTHDSLLSGYNEPCVMTV